MVDGLSLSLSLSLSKINDDEALSFLDSVTTLSLALYTHTHISTTYDLMFTFFP